MIGTRDPALFSIFFVYIETYSRSCVKKAACDIITNCLTLDNSHSTKPREPLHRYGKATDWKQTASIIVLIIVTICYTRYTKILAQIGREPIFAIEGFNRQIRKETKAKSVFSTDDSLLKMLYLVMMDITKKWTGRQQDWSVIHAQLAVFCQQNTRSNLLTLLDTRTNSH